MELWFHSPLLIHEAVLKHNVKLNLYYLLLGLLSHSSFIGTLQVYVILACLVEKVMLTRVRNKQMHKNAIAAN